MAKIHKPGADSGAAFSQIKVDLPDLNEPTGIRPANILALQAIYVGAQLEQLKIFSVLERLVQLFQNGALPLGNNGAGRILDDYRKRIGSRMTAPERLNVYARVFGIESGGASSTNVNRDFDELWLDFVSSVSEFVRQLDVGKPLGSAQIKVKKAGRDLAENLSLHGYGVGYFAASELRTQVNDIMAILSHPEIRSAYGAASPWQVVEQVAILELGGAVNTTRYRTMAIAGAIVIRWLAQRASVLASAAKSSVLRIKQLRSSAHSSKPMLKPTDRDLAEACEQWLAAAGIPEGQVGR